MPLYTQSLRATARAIASPRAWAALNRAGTLIVAYLSTALGIVGAIYVLRGHTDAATLAGVIAALFMIQLTAGLEPATVRGLLLAKEQPRMIPVPLVVHTAAAKAIVASPAIWGVWWFVWADASSLVWLAALAPLLTTIGFITSDARSLYEARGCYALGIWVKQGSVLIGMLLLAAACLAGAPILSAIVLSQVGRVLFLLPFLFHLLRTSEAPGEGANGARGVATLLRQPQWQPLAGISILSAASGSLDRLVVLRYLSPTESATYIVLFEFLSKYWLLAYLLSPIMFARRASGIDPHRFRRQAELVLSAGGVVVVLGAAFGPTLFPELARRLLGDAPSGMLVVILALAFAFNSFCQLLTADLQGHGRAHRVIVLQAALLAGSVPLFFGLVQVFDLTGVGAAWLVRASVECALLWRMDRRLTQSKWPETPKAS